MTTEQYLEAITTEYYDGSAWVDISAYVVGDIKGNNGLGGWRPENRVAVLGILNITLNNKSKIFSPMGGDSVRGLPTLTGWNKGARIRISGTFRSLNEIIWKGIIASIDSDDLNWGNEQARVTATDYMNVPVNYPMKGAAIGLNKRIDEAMTTIMSRLSQQPRATNFDTGSFTFPAVFDNVQRKTLALSEFTKLANSELGYIYVTQDETLRVENMLARHGWRALDEITIPEKWIVSTDRNYLAMEDGNFLLLETGGKILLDEGTLEAAVTEDASLAADAEGYNILLAEDGLLNASIIRAHPVITDTSLKVLYKLGTPLPIHAGQTVQFSAHYTDPSGLSQVSGTNMQTPVATTDYLANTAQDGSGTNKTANVTVTATYYGDTVYYSIYNNDSGGVYITFLQARGYGIYYGNSIESTIDDTTSQDDYGYFPFQFDMKYQKDTYLADMYGKAVIEEYKLPKSRITKMKYLANLNKNHLVSFLLLSIGSLILGTEDRSGISNHYYITDRAFTIKQGGIIHVEYGVKQNDSYLSGGLKPVTVEFRGGSYKDSIDFGFLPVVKDSLIGEYSLSSWIYVNGTNPNSQTVMSIYSSSGDGVVLWVYERQVILFDSIFSGDSGLWYSPVNAYANAAWVHVVTTYNSAAASDPIMYVNGSPVATTEITTPTGTKSSFPYNLLAVGNIKTASTDYANPFYGKIFNPCIYNRVLTAAKVTTLYNAGNPDHTLVTDGLVFQGMATYADRPLSAGHVLTSTDRLVENIIRAVGIPNGSPTIRANP